MEIATSGNAVALQIISNQLVSIESLLELIVFVILLHFILKQFDILKFIQKGKYK